MPSEPCERRDATGRRRMDGRSRAAAAVRLGSTPALAGNPRGFTTFELLIALVLSFLLIGGIVQVFVLTARTTQQASVRVDMQGQARRALQSMDKELRDAFAILPSYTLRTAPYTTYITRMTANERTIVAAVPSMDDTGAMCVWLGQNMVFDCIIWQAIRNAAGKWDMSRLTVTDAFRMLQPYVGAYQMPTAFGRTQELSPVKVFSDANTLSVELRGDSSIIAPNGSVTEPPAVGAYRQLPVYVDAAGQATTTHMTVTDVSGVSITLSYASNANTLESRKGYTVESDGQSVAIRLRNKQDW